MKTYIVNAKSGQLKIKADNVVISFSKYIFVDAEGTILAAFNDNEVSGCYIENTETFESRLDEANDKIKHAELA